MWRWSSLRTKDFHKFEGDAVNPILHSCISEICPILLHVDCVDKEDTCIEYYTNKSKSYLKYKKQ